MIRRNTWIVLLLFVVVAALAFYLQQNKPEENALATPTAVPAFLLDVSESSIVGLTVQSADGKQLRLERLSSGEWSLIEPAAEATDTNTAQAAVVQLATVKVVSSPGSLPGLDALNLATATYKILLDLLDGSQIVIDVGKETPTGSGYYVLVSNSNQVVVAGKSGLDAVIQLLDNPPALATATPEVTATEDGTAPEMGEPTAAP